jgi:hypothetical protein
MIHSKRTASMHRFVFLRPFAQFLCLRFQLVAKLIIIFYLPYNSGMNWVIWKSRYVTLKIISVVWFVIQSPSSASAWAEIDRKEAIREVKK